MDAPARADAEVRPYTGMGSNVGTTGRADAEVRPYTGMGPNVGTSNSHSGQVTPPTTDRATILPRQRCLPGVDFSAT